jgi:hypothetical protein
MSVFTNPAGATPEQVRQYAAAVLDLLGEQDPLIVLRQTKGSLDRLIEGLTLEELALPEAPGKWSISTVLQHLADAELVWGYRLRMVLAEDSPPIVGYDQDSWSSRLHYEQASTQDARERFAVLRHSNARIVEHASEADLQRFGVHAVRGEQTLRELSRWWAGHDLLHLRQIGRIRNALHA